MQPRGLLHASLVNVVFHADLAGGPFTKPNGARPHVYLFDVQRQPSLVNCLRPLLTSPAVAKVMWDCRTDSRVLHRDLGLDVAGVVDLQLAHIEWKRARGFPVDIRASWGRTRDSLCPSMANLWQELATGDHARWHLRPLPATLLRYAVEVSHADAFQTAAPSLRTARRTSPPCRWH